MGALNCKDRLVAAAHKAEVDRVPCICPGGMMNMIVHEVMEKTNNFWPEAHSDSQKMAGLTVALHEAGGFENYGVPFCMTIEAEAMGAVVDMGTDMEEPHVVISPLKSPMEADLLKNVDLNSGRMATVLDAIRILKAKNSDVPIIGNITGPISVAGTLVDMAVLLVGLRKHPQETAHMLDIVTNNIILYARAMVEAGADVICLSEPSGTGEILGMEHFINFSLPYVNKVMDALDVDVKIVHICGRLHNIYEAIAEIRCDVFSFDALVDIEEIKPYITNKSIMGNINTHALAVMPKEKIKSLTRGALLKGVNIVSPACGLAITTPMENIIAMVETTKYKGQVEEHV